MKPVCCNSPKAAWTRFFSVVTCSDFAFLNIITFLSVGFWVKFWVWLKRISLMLKFKMYSDFPFGNRGWWRGKGWGDTRIVWFGKGAKSFL
jgi:hypothetical protein